jgi:hypothetical protein
MTPPSTPPAPPAPAGDTLPRTKQGRVLWEQVPGFRGWIRDRGPGLTNRELVTAIRERYGAELSAGAVGSLRRSYGALETVETRRRAYIERDTEPIVPPEPELSPEEKMERDLLRQQVQRLSARQTFYEIVGEKILAAIAKLPPLACPPPAPRPDCRALGEEEMALVVSDVQAGLKVDVKESGGLGSYNTVTLLEQLAYLQRSVLSIHRYHPNVTVFHAMFLGDIVEGETIYGGQLREIDQGVIDQALFSIEHFARYLQALAGVFETVHCYGVIGNHGRIGRRGEHGPRSNFDYLVYRILAERLAPVTNLRWHVAESWWQLATIQGWRFLLVHGDDVASGSYGGIPFYGITRHKFRYRELFKTTSWFRDSEVDDFDYMVIGHHSEPAEFLNVIMNGSWPGGTEFSLKRLQLSAIPTQKLFGVHRNHGVTWVRNVHLRPLRVSP